MIVNLLLVTILSGQLLYFKELYLIEEGRWYHPLP